MNIEIHFNELNFIRLMSMKLTNNLKPRDLAPGGKIETSC